jgi:hypothetical protein
MAVLSKDEFFSRLQSVVGTDTSDASIAFIEDMTDTYNDLESRGNGDCTDWEERYNELDKAWAEKYKSRFFSTGGGNAPKVEENECEQEVTPETITVDDLFK